MILIGDSGDTFVIFSRGKGWWSVQRDKNGYVDLDPQKQGWVPAGCLLETTAPVTCSALSFVISLMSAEFYSRHFTKHYFSSDTTFEHIDYELSWSRTY